MKEELLHLLTEDARLHPQELARRLGSTEEEVRNLILSLEEEGVILGYRAEVNWDLVEEERTTALIEVRVTPQLGQGFDRIAHRIYEYPEVTSCYLMSGSFDLMVILEDKTLRDVARFVSDRIAPLEAVLSTSTHFILKKYKDNGLIFARPNLDEREAVIL